MPAYRRKPRRAAGTRTVSDLLLLRFLTRSAARDVRELHAMRNGDQSVRPISISCFCRGCLARDDRSRLGHLVLDGERIWFTSRDGEVDLSQHDLVLAGLAARPGSGVAKKGLFTELKVAGDMGELRISVPTADLLLVQTAFGRG